MSVRNMDPTRTKTFRFMLGDKIKCNEHLPPTPHFCRQMPGPRWSGQIPALCGVGFASGFYVVWASLLRGKPTPHRGRHLLILPRRAGICRLLHLPSATRGLFFCFCLPRAQHLPIEVGWGLVIGIFLMRFSHIPACREHFTQTIC